MKKILSAFLLLLSFTSCSHKVDEPTAHFFISNSSESKKVVDLVLKVNNETLFDQNIKYTDIQPDLQYTPSKQLPKGEYTLTVLADSGKVVEEQTLSLDSDRWIFISYGFVAEADSSAKEEWRKGNSDILAAEPDYLPAHLKYSAPRVKVYVMDNEPVHH